MAIRRHALLPFLILELLRTHLDALASALLSGERLDVIYAHRIQKVLLSTDACVEEFLKSNELWGGSGSIADQAFIDAEVAARRTVTQAFAALGRAQLSLGIVNVRTQMWTEAFENWTAAQTD